MSEKIVEAPRPQPTSPEKEYPFEGEYRDIAQLGSYEADYAYVNQGFAWRSVNRAEIASEGFSYCSALLICNEETGETCLAHIDDWRLHSRQYDVIEKLPAGKYMLRMVVGKLSRLTSDTLFNRKTSEFLSRFENDGRQVTLEPDLLVDSNVWGLLYDPKRKRLKIYRKKEHLVGEYQL